MFVDYLYGQSILTIWLLLCPKTNRKQCCVLVHVMHSTEIFLCKNIACMHGRVDIECPKLMSSGPSRSRFYHNRKQGNGEFSLSLFARKSSVSKTVHSHIALKGTFSSLKQSRFAPTSKPRSECLSKEHKFHRRSGGLSSVIFTILYMCTFVWHEISHKPLNE